MSPPGASPPAATLPAVLAPAPSPEASIPAAKPSPVARWAEIAGDSPQRFAPDPVRRGGKRSSAVDGDAFLARLREAAAVWAEEDAATAPASIARDERPKSVRTPPKLASAAPANESEAVEVVPEPRPKPQPKPELALRPELSPELKPEPAPAPAPEPEPEPEPELAAKVEPEPEPALKRHPEPELAVKTEPAVARQRKPAGPPLRSAQAKPAARPQPLPDPRPTGRPKPRPETKPARRPVTPKPSEAATPEAPIRARPRLRPTGLAGGAAVAAPVAPPAAAAPALPHAPSTAPAGPPAKPPETPVMPTAADLEAMPVGPSAPGPVAPAPVAAAAAVAAAVVAAAPPTPPTHAAPSVPARRAPSEPVTRRSGGLLRSVARLLGGRPAPPVSPGAAAPPRALDTSAAVTVAGDLTSHGAGHVFASQLISAAAAHGVALAGGLRDAAQSELARRIVPAPALPPGGAAVAFVGAGGSGKSMCTASLAAAYRRASTLTVCVVAIDAPDGGRELSASLRPLGVPVHAGSREDLAEIVRDARIGGLVIVDTPAVTPTDSAEVDALGELLEPMGLDAIYVTLPATLGPQAARRALASFSGLRPTAVAVTHADETDQLGVAVEIAVTHRIPVAFLHAGTDPARAISAADPVTIAHHLLP